MISWYSLPRDDEACLVRFVEMIINNMLFQKRGKVNAAQPWKQPRTAGSIISVRGRKPCRAGRVPFAIAQRVHCQIFNMRAVVPG